MKILTAEIKMLIKECVKQGGMYDVKSTQSKKKDSIAEVKNPLKIQMYNTLIQVEGELEGALSSIDIWKLNDDNFEIITKIRNLKDYIEDIKIQCK